MADTPAIDGYGFGPYRLSMATKQLYRGTQPVRLGGRALDILGILVERAGQVVSKDELLALAWPGIIVGEATLRVHIASLRKAIGDGQDGARYITNISGRGYCFVAPLRKDQPERAVQPEKTSTAALPPVLDRMVGRAEAIDALSQQLRDRRLVTITGPGGIGKTTVALAVAERAQQVYRDGVVFIDLSPVSGGDAAASALATALGVQPTSGGEVANVAAQIAQRNALLLIDNCEHVIDVVANFVEHTLRTARSVSILATSREPIRVDGESVHRLPSLPTARAEDSEDPEQALAYPAVQLFVERARATHDAFHLAAGDAGVVSEICRRLDGIPLAIELVAARVAQWGVRGLAAEIETRLLSLTQNRRSVLPRHRTLGAMLDWSFERLSEAEQAILRRLSVFAGRFSYTSVIAVGLDESLLDVGVDDVLQNLAAKSLIVADHGDGLASFRLLEMTRAYAYLKLQEAGEVDATRTRLAELCRTTLNQAEQDWPDVARSEWVSIYGTWIDDIRQCIDWAFSASGSQAIGVELTAAAVPLACQLSLFREFRQRVERALQCHAQLATPHALAEVQLNTFLGTVKFHESGSGSHITAAYARTVALSESLAGFDHEKSATLDLFHWAFSLGDYRAAMNAAEHLGILGRSESDLMLTLTSERQIAQASHFLGDHARGRAYAERVLNHPRRGVKLPGGSPMQTNRQVTMRIVLARVLWIEGAVDQAMSVAMDAVHLGANDISVSLSQALALAACPIAIWRGDDRLATELTERLAVHARAASTDYWSSWAELLTAVLHLRAGHIGLMPSLQLLGAKQLDALASLDWRCASGESLERVERGVVGWCGPEILRGEGEIALASGEPDGTEIAERYFVRSLQMASQHGALSWRLRAATSLARLRRTQGRVQEALETLVPVHELFREGLSTADVLVAGDLIESMQRELAA